MGAATLTACATDAASKTDVSEVMASVRALRAENARLESRIESLEAASKVPSRVVAAAPARSVVEAKETSMTELPSLTVVKLKPKREPASKVATTIAVEEPPETVLAELSTSAPAKAAGNDDDPTVADTQYERAVDLIKTGSIETGIAQLQQFATEWPKHPRADNALYFAGIGLMTSKDFEGAAKVFDDVTRRYPAGDAVLDALLKSAECRHKLNRPTEARAVYQQIVASYPGTAAASQAQARLTEPR